jgi:tryptophanase
MNLADKLRKINRFLRRAAGGLTVFVDVKTIMPEPKDRWEQFEKSQ